MGFSIEKAAEKSIENLFIKEVEKRGGQAFKWVCPGKSGVPDRIAFLPSGNLYFCELKSETGEVSQRQKKVFEKLEKMNRKVYILKGFLGVKKFFEEVDKIEEIKWKKKT